MGTIMGFPLTLDSIISTPPLGVPGGGGDGPCLSGGVPGGDWPRPRSLGPGPWALGPLVPGPGPWSLGPGPWALGPLSQAMGLEFFRILEIANFPILGFEILRYWGQVEDGGLSFGKFYITRSCEED